MYNSKIKYQNQWIINKAKRLLATAHLKMLYLSLIEPHLTYCCNVWASLKKTTSLEVLYKLQKHTARIIMFVHHLTHAQPLFRKLNIFIYNIQKYDLCKCQILIFVYKCYNNLLPPICVNYFTHTKDVHQYSTRSSKNNNQYRINANKSCRIN